MPTNKSSLTVEEIQQNVELAKEAARRAVCSSVRSRRAVRDNSERGAGCGPNLAIGRWQNDKVGTHFLVLDITFALTVLLIKVFQLMRFLFSF